MNEAQIAKLLQPAAKAVLERMNEEDKKRQERGCYEPDPCLLCDSCKREFDLWEGPQT